MQKYYILETEFGAEAGLIDEVNVAPKDAKVVNNIKQAERELTAALARIEKAFDAFIEESEREAEPENPEKPTPPRQQKPKPRKDKKGK